MAKPGLPVPVLCRLHPKSPQDPCLALLMPAEPPGARDELPPSPLAARAPAQPRKWQR